MEAWQSQWLAAIRALTATPTNASGYLDRRLQFTNAVARALSHDHTVLDALVYGIWLEGHTGPIYIGQTLEGRRRLWDLPIGESHHLANSFPPEIWSRVIVVYWGLLLDKRPEMISKLTTDLLPIIGQKDLNSVIGLGLEYLLQRRYLPLFNRRKKRRDGGWREVVWENSGSVGARAAPYLKELFDVVVDVWEELERIPNSGELVRKSFGGRIVFPSSILVSISQCQIDK